MQTQLLRLKIRISILFLLASQLLAISYSRADCYFIPELIRIPKELENYEPEIFDPKGQFIVFKSLDQKKNKPQKKLIFSLNDKNFESLGNTENHTFSSSGSFLSYEAKGNPQTLFIRDLSTQQTKTITEDTICGHRILENSRRTYVLTCKGEFKTYDFRAEKPKLIKTTQIQTEFDPNSIHFNLDHRASFLFRPSTQEDQPATLQMIDFERAQVYSAHITPPHRKILRDISSYVSRLNSKNVPAEAQNQVARYYKNHGGVTVSPQGHTALIWDNDSNAVGVNLDHGKVTSLTKVTDPTQSFLLSPQGSFIFSRKEGKPEEGNQGKIGSELKFKFNAVTFSEDDSKIAYSKPNQKELIIFSRTNQKKIKIPLEYIRESSFFFNPTGSELLYYQEKNEIPELFFFNTETGKQERKLNLSQSIQQLENRSFIENGKKIIFGNASLVEGGTSKIVDLSTGEVEDLGASVPHLSSGSDQDLIIWPYSGYRNFLLHNKKICTQTPPNQSGDLFKKCNKNVKPDELIQLALDLPIQIGAELDQDQIKLACKKLQKPTLLNQSTDLSLSSSMTTAIRARLQTINKHPPTKTELTSLLLAIQNESFELNPESIPPLFESAYKNGLIEQSPDLIQNVLIRLFSENKPLYFELVKKFNPKKGSLTSLETSCFSSSQIEQLKKELSSYLRHSSLEPIHFSKLDRLQPLSPVFKQLPKKQQDPLIEELGLALARSAQRDFPGIMTSTLYYFISPQIREKLLGTPAPNYTELSFLRENGNLTPVILSTHPIDSEKNPLNPHGFYHRVLETQLSPKSEGAISQKNYDWTTHGRSYLAQVSLKKISASQLFPRRSSPDYPALWKDHQLTGMILLSSNLGNDAQVLGDEYLRYFKDQGFTVDRLNSKTTDIAEFLKKTITSGELDYLVKDAHSGGVIQDLVTLLNEARIYRGTRELPEGKTEKIYIAVPAQGGSPRTITTADFGSWIRERDESGHGELVYFNTSCFGGERTASDIAAAGSSKLLAIAVHPIQTTSFFINHPNNATYQLLQSIRNKQDFQGFRNQLSQSPDYQLHKKNTYLMPDDPDYGEKIINQLKSVPISAEVKIYDQDHHQVHFDPLSDVSQKRSSTQ